MPLKFNHNHINCSVVPLILHHNKDRIDFYELNANHT